MTRLCTQSSNICRLVYEEMVYMYGIDGAKEKLKGAITLHIEYHESLQEIVNSQGYSMGRYVCFNEILTHFEFDGF